MNQRMHKRHQYIGVTGFGWNFQVGEALKALPEKTQTKLMVGVLVSSKSLQDKPGVKKTRYPTPTEIHHIFTSSRRTLNLVHFNSKEPERLLDHLLQVEEFAGENFHGFQLNIPWPNPDTLHRWVAKSKKGIGNYVVLQCGQKAFESVKNSPEELAVRLRDYDNLIDYVLLDLSGGENKPLDPAFTLRCLEELHDKLSHLCFGIAGGITAQTIPSLLEPVLKEFPDVSFDAEGGLRDQADRLDSHEMQNYLKSGAALIQKYEKSSPLFQD